MRNKRDDALPSNGDRTLLRIDGRSLLAYDFVAEIVRFRTLDVGPSEVSRLRLRDATIPVTNPTDIPSASKVYPITKDALSASCTRFFPSTVFAVDIYWFYRRIDRCPLPLAHRFRFMARPKTPHPTPGELEILKILWETGSLTVREVLDLLNRTGAPRAYTSIMSLLNVMADKGLLERVPEGRAFRYRPLVERSQTLGGLVGDVWQRAFGGSASSLVARLLDQAQPSPAELAEIRRLLKNYDPPRETP